jgi:hypothetical protein
MPSRAIHPSSFLFRAEERKREKEKEKEKRRPSGSSSLTSPFKQHLKHV